ncbi:MAG: hypothetical protein JNG84_05050 [Archangium sp.]|nr:hypothetical protein [Archangium sp.]
MNSFKVLVVSVGLLCTALIASGCGSTGSGSCSASSCSGCCQGDVCQNGTTASACGKSGVSCTACTSAQTCSSSQACAFDGAAMWKVQPLSATIKNNNNGASWDPDDSAPDAYVELYCPMNATQRTTATPTVNDSYTPTWSADGCVVSASALTANGFAYQVLDGDTLSNDSITQKISVVVTEADLAAGRATVAVTDGLLTLNIGLQKQ